MAELSVRWLRGNSFPFLNIFEADERYGVVLFRDAETQTRSRDGHVTAIETNSEGFRGPDWQVDPSRKSVLLLGDSQVFGYGVAWRNTFAAKLQESLGAEFQILNAAVPTWGPTEYLLAMDELTARYHPTSVVFVANVANDWFEAPVSNTIRTSAQDGWAVRQHKNLASPTWFPGRSWLANRSQLWFLGKRTFAAANSSKALPSSVAKMLLRNVRNLRGTDRFESPLGQSLEKARTLCERRGCELLAVSLPLDVQVHRAEWEKYRETPVNMAPSEVLLEDFLRDADALGLRNTNLLSLLRKASPGAFLSDDYHLSARGHDAIASELESLILASPKRISHAR